MRISRWLVPALLVLPGELSGQVATWTLAAGLDGVRFGAAARDTTAPTGQAVSLRPGGRVGARVALQRAAGTWRVELALGWAGGNVEADNDAVAIRDRTVDFSRYRVSAGVEGRVARVGAGELALAARPTLDLWSLDGETRLRVGAEGGLALRLPLGGASLENRIEIGMSGSPLEPADMDEEFETSPLRAVTVGVGLRLPL